MTASSREDVEAIRKRRAPSDPTLMATYAGNITHPALEAPFQAQRWDLG